MELLGFGYAEDQGERHTTSLGNRLNTSALQGPESLKHSSPPCISTVGLWLRNKESAFALPLLLIIVWDTINVHSVCNST